MLLLSIFLIFVYIFLCKTINNPLLRRIIRFFAVLYGVQITMAIWDPYHVYSISLISIICFNVQILCFITGASICKKSKSAQGLDTSSFEWPNIEINMFMLVVITVLFVYCYYNYNRMQSFLLFMASTTDEGREFYYTSFFSSYTMRVLDWFITSFKYVAIVVSLTLLFKKGKKLNLKEIYFVVLTLSSFILLLLTEQSRLSIFVIVFIIVIFVIISSIYDKQRFRRMVLPSVIVVFVGFAALFLSVTLLRANLNNADYDRDFIDLYIIEPFATYFYIPILAFDYTKGSMLNFEYPLC